jgi:Zn-dependent peptidase ImmA (M78 family)
MNKAEINYQASDSATEFRRRFDLGQSAPIRVDTLLHKLDLLTVFTEMSDSFSGMAARLEENGFLLINCNHPKGRQIFTICHELYHLFIQKKFEFEVISDAKGSDKDINERLADAFASELLMPEKGIQELLLKENYIHKKIELDQIIKLEQYFQVSRQSMFYRLLNLGFIDKKENLEQTYFSNVKESAEKRGYPTDLYEKTKPCVISSDYFDKAQYLYKKDKIGLHDYAQLLHDVGIDIYSIMGE